MTNHSVATIGQVRIDIVVFLKCCQCLLGFVGISRSRRTILYRIIHPAAIRELGSPHPECKFHVHGMSGIRKNSKLFMNCLPASETGPCRTHVGHLDSRKPTEFHHLHIFIQLVFRKINNLILYADRTIHICTTAPIDIPKSDNRFSLLHPGGLVNHQTRNMNGGVDITYVLLLGTGLDPSQIYVNKKMHPFAHSVLIFHLDKHLTVFNQYFSLCIHTLVHTEGNGIRIRCAFRFYTQFLTTGSFDICL